MTQITLSRTDSVERQHPSPQSSPPRGEEEDWTISLQKGEEKSEIFGTNVGRCIPSPLGGEGQGEG